MGSAHSTDAAAAPVPEPEPAAASVPAPARLITADDVFNAAHTCTNEMMKMMHCKDQFIPSGCSPVDCSEEERLFTECREKTKEMMASKAGLRNK